jgi:hypothetical protein
MTKQVEVPESAVELALRSLIEDRMTPPRGEELEVIRQDLREALEAALPSIYKHFSDRLKEPKIVEMIFGAEYGDEDVAALDEVIAALQATPTPEVDRG